MNDRDYEILNLLAAGHQTKEIAVKLNLSRRTIGEDVQNLMIDFGALTRTHLIAEVMRKGLIT